MNMKILATLLPLLTGALSSCWSPAGRAAGELKHMRAEVYFQDPIQIELVKAVQKGDTAGIDAAISKGADVNKLGQEEMTPLAWAFAKQNKVGYQHLLEKGADPNFKTKKKAWNNHGSSIMQFAALSEDPEYLLLALQHKGNPNAPDSLLGKTILFTAIRNHRPENVKILVRAGADINHQDKAGFTPLMNTVTGDNYDLSMVLLSLGADATIKTPEGKNVGDIVAMFGDRGIKVLGKENEQRAWYNQFVSELKRRGLM
jgi:ankyrin repeat protein